LCVLLVARKWADIDPENEFRLFVVNGVPNALTQYHKDCFVKGFVSHKKQIEDIVLAEFNKIKHKIIAPKNTYSVDFVMDSSFSKAIMVEINDPPPTAGTSLFVWENPEDKKIIMEGPFTFRVLTSGIPWKSVDIHQPLKQFIDEFRGRQSAQQNEPLATNENKNNNNGDPSSDTLTKIFETISSIFS